MATTLTQRALLYGLLCLFPLALAAQVTCDPVFPTQPDNVTITFNAAEGNGALAGFVGPVYAHMGVITNLSTSPTDWKYVPTTWGTADPVGAMTNAGGGLWTKSFNIQQFFNVAGGETVLKLAFVFRNQAGNTVGRAADGSDIYYDVYPVGGGLLTKFVTPTNSAFLSSVGASIPVKAASSLTASLTLFDNGTSVSTANGKTLQTNLTASGGFHTVQFVANTGTETDTSTFTYLVPGTVTQQDPPAGTELGAQIIDNQTVRFTLYAPGKQNVFLLSDLSNWQPNLDYQLRNSTDGKRWWIEIGGLTPGQPFKFQYLVDGSLKVADPLSTLVLDPNNDPFVPALTFPNLPAYPTGKTSGVVSLVTPGATPFVWTTNNYVRPKKTDLVVYELLVRDFVARHDFQTILDTLDYLQNLGVTAIEFMPLNEFDGNINWGYGPSYHKALDKYYGSPEALKMLVDECHARGIAVVLDVVFNQATGASPLAQLYWDSANNRPASNNPWLNPTATHPFNVFNDFNHESAATKEYVKNCVAYWLTEFRFDGFRFDLSKGFTQVNSGGSVSQWGQYDASRVAIWKDYADFIWDVDPECYVILEHFAANNEEKELAEYGMMLWGNMWGAYKDVALGFSSGLSADLRWVDYKQRGWAVPHVVGYMESHDEDRIAYECKTYGNVVGDYNVKNLVTGLRRIEMLEQLFYTVPGPKMLWQFGELGYDFPINWCENGTINNDCRTGPKPIRWDYLQDPNRRRLHDVTAALLNLRQQFDAFETTDYVLNIGPNVQVRSVTLAGSDLTVLALANIGMTSTTASVSFQNAQTWYEYYTGDTLQAAAGINNLPLEAGEYRLYLSQFVPLPNGIEISSADEPIGAVSNLAVYPNPTHDAFAVRFSLLENATLNVAVHDATGRLVATPLTRQALFPGEQGIQIDASQWQPGIYFVTLQDESGARATRRVVKM